MAENDSRSSRRLTSRCAKLSLMGRVGPGRLPRSPDLLCFATCRRLLTLLQYRKKIPPGLLFSRQNLLLKFLTLSSPLSLSLSSPSPSLLLPHKMPRHESLPFQLSSLLRFTQSLNASHGATHCLAFCF